MPGMDQIRHGLAQSQMNKWARIASNFPSTGDDSQGVLSPCRPRNTDDDEMNEPSGTSGQAAQPALEPPPEVPTLASRVEGPRTLC